MSQIYTDPQTGRRYEVGPDGRSRWVDQPVIAPELHYQPRPEPLQYPAQSYPPQQPEPVQYPGQQYPPQQPEPVQYPAQSYPPQQPEPLQYPSQRPEPLQYQRQPEPLQYPPQQPEPLRYRPQPEPLQSPHQEPQPQQYRSRRTPQQRGQANPTPQSAPRQVLTWKSHALRYTLFGALGLIIVIGVISAVTKGGNTTASTGAASAASASTSAAQAATKAAGFGGPVNEGTMEFTVVGVRTTAKVGNATLNQTAQGTFVLVSMTARNFGNQAQMFDLSSQTFLDAAGRQYPSSGAAAMFLGAEAKGFLQQIDPGNAVTGVVVFDVPRGTKLTTLKLHNAPHSRGVNVPLPVTVK
ncbi:MAG TPA: DUF4352 domain-containing protein [Kineosporiaceae bacterium]|nr:DUF4352 domain-containing protein [Kineosporiaceae bacterium]